ARNRSARAALAVRGPAARLALQPAESTRDEQLRDHEGVRAAAPLQGATGARTEARDRLTVAARARPVRATGGGMLPERPAARSPTSRHLSSKLSSSSSAANRSRLGR